MQEFSPGYESTKNVLSLLYNYKLANKEKDDNNLYAKRYVYFNFFHETVNSYNLETANRIAHVIFVLHSAMKTQLLTYQNACTIQIII